MLAVDPQFEVVTAAYPHVARALLADRDARARQALRRLVLDRHGRVRWRRLEALGKSAFSDVTGSMDSVIDRSWWPGRRRWCSDGRLRLRL